MKFYFTFGCNDTQPYCGGWVEIIAESFDEATEKYVKQYPLTEDGLINCASRYPEEEFIETGMNLTGNRGYFCHEVIT